ncbi:MAG: TraM recognition domain-containing protein, partial [Bacteroidetes bacterium]|nr:TraM recognition domain-containing protein [Bacteroidota bacterium]
NLVNPPRGVLIIGSPGSGKSWFIIEPFIRQLIEKGVAMFIYDFKHDALTKVAWAHFQANRDKYPVNTPFYSINFTDLSRSHRCNILDPSTLTYLSDALDASRTILLSINKTWANRQGDFFVESPINFVAALIWFLRKYRDGIYCTLPHVVELSKVSYDRLFPLLQADPDIDTLVNPFIEAYNNKTMEMLDGQVAGAKIPLGRLSSPELYYVLTGNDFTLDINNPSAPKIFCLGGDPARVDALAPVLSLYIDRLTRICNRPGQYPCALVCDEFATVRAYNMANTIATGRSNNIIPILAIQDASQLRTRYSHEEANTILNICGNLLCGQVGGETARWASDHFPKILQERASVSVNSVDTSVSTTQQWEQTISTSTISALSSGEFIGITADEPRAEQEFKTFHAKLLRPNTKTSYAKTPIIREVNKEIIQQQFNAVKSEVAQIVLNSLNYQINNSSSPNADFSDEPLPNQ